MLEAASTRQQLTRACVRHALQQLPHGFEALDTCLLYHASLVNDAYDKWYRAFAQAVRVSILVSVLPVDTREDHQGGALFITGMTATPCISAADAACTFRAASYAPGMLGRRFNTMWYALSFARSLPDCIHVCSMKLGHEISLCRAMKLPRSWRRMTKRGRCQKNCTTTTL